MPIILDETTRAEYLAQTVASTRASLVVNALTAPVVVEVFNGSNSLRATGTMASPWATASGATITIGEVNAAGINVSAGGGPTSLWYCQFRGANGRFVRGTFGLPGQGRDFTWSLASFEAGSKGTLGTVTLTADGTTALTSPLPTFTVENWGASSSAGFLRAGMPFEKGAIPAGSSVQITRAGSPVAAQFDERTTWSDGSLKFAVCHLRDTAFSAGESRTYQITLVPGAFNNAGTRTLTDATAAVDPAIEFSSLTQFNGSTTVTRASGAAFARFATHAAVATRATKIHSGPVCEGWMVWGMARDGVAGAGAEDAHLKTIWYVDLWKNADGSIADVEYAAVVSQDWWGVANKFRLNYTATLKDGASTVATYSGLQHAYRSQWATVRTAADNNHARRHWKTSIPTLTYKPDRTYWITSKLVPPFKIHTPNANSAVTYTPLGGVGHRTSIDDQGAYPGRGLLPVMDVVAFMRQTAVDFRYARTSAFAGLHVPHHYRDERTRTRPGDGSADIANTAIPLLMGPKPDSAADFTAFGMPAAKHAYVPSGGSLGGGYVNYTGGDGGWSPSGDNSHAVNYSYFMYLHEGERYLWEAVLDSGMKAIQGLPGNEFGAAPRAIWYESPIVRAASSIPTTQYFATANLRSPNNTRGTGWGLMLVGAAAGVVPDNDPHAPYLRALNAQQGDYIAYSLQYAPANVKSIGYWTDGGFTWIGSPWMNGMITQGAYFNAALTENANVFALGEMTANMTTSLWEQGGYMVEAYRGAYDKDAANFDPATNLWQEYGDLLGMVYDVTIAANGVMTVIPDYPFFDQLVAGDAFYFYNRSAIFSDVAVPSGYTRGTPLYVVDPVGMTCRFALTPGGTPVTYAPGSYLIAGTFSRVRTPTVATFPPYLPIADSYTGIAYATLMLAARNGHPKATPALVAKAKTFTQNMDLASWPSWYLDA